MIEREGWWEQPEDANKTPWNFHPFKFADAGAHMLVYDVNGDGLNDVVTAWHCHLYGLVWYKQMKDADGKITWERFEIIPVTPDLNSDALRITQMHAFNTADFNGDGLLDFVTGKRFWAHGSKGDKEAGAPAVLYWFELKRDGNGGAAFIPHQIDDNSGVGIQVTTVDLNNDKTPDIIVANKKGTFVFLSE
ncbi:MAG: VCBS repeat-containing protein [Tannerella sp.]|nr:VCBS repeat-containing protein [Tannerella sp.]